MLQIASFFPIFQREPATVTLNRFTAFSGCSVNAMHLKNGLLTQILHYAMLHKNKIYN